MSRRTGQHGSAVGQFGHHRAVVVVLHGHDPRGHAVFLQAAACGIGHALRGLPHGVVENQGALLRLLLGQVAVHVDDEAHGLLAPVDQAVVRSDHVDVQLFHHGQGFEHHGGIGQYDVVEIFLDPLHEFAVVPEIVRETGAAGDVLAEDVVADQQFFLGNVRNHAVRPVQHAGFLKDDVAAADVQDVAAFHGLHGPVLAREIPGHGLEPGLGDEDFFRLDSLHHFCQGARMVQFDVVADDVIHFFGCQGLGQTAEQRARAAGSHSVYEHVFLVFDQIGVVGGAVRRAGIAVKVAVIVINAAHPENVFFDFNRLHVNSPESAKWKGNSPSLKAPPRRRTGKAGKDGNTNRNQNLGGIELVLAHAAHRADPVVGKLIERHVVMFRRVIFIAANATDVFLHGYSPFFDPRARAARLCLPKLEQFYFEML